jgi:cyclopropane-fatty-acyl-phospholipid synthase
MAEEGPVASSMADHLKPMIDVMLGVPTPLRINFWDGSALGPTDGPGTLFLKSPLALRRIVWAPGQLGLGRAYVAGDIDFEGDVIDVMSAVATQAPRDTSLLKVAAPVIAAAKKVGAIGKPPPPPDCEYRPQGLRAHTLGRDAKAIQHHYDVSNEFYDLVLGPAMTYSCARFAEPTMTLAEAQASKHDHICRKLDLQPGQRLLDIGCGWGSMVMHAATHYGVQAVGITISAAQAERARQRVAEAGLADRVEIRLQDYRDVGAERFDAVSSIGMSEHVGNENLDRYFEIIRRVLPDHGRLLNHAISSIGGSKLSKNSFAYRYVFPDGELIDLGRTIEAMQRAGFEVRDVESLREHYATTLRHWVRNLEANWDTAVTIAGIERARVWRLYMAASAVGFTGGGLNLHQVLGVVQDPMGGSGMGSTRPV